MPLANNNITGEPWRSCDRCGFLYPIGQLRKQLGFLLCNVTCTDDLSNDRRPMQIARMLAGATRSESTNPIAERLRDKGEVIFDGNNS